jgi:hypothetical protein
MENIKQSLKNILLVKPDYQAVENYAKEKFRESFHDNHNTWYRYDKFEVLDESHLKIYYTHGGGSMEFMDELIVSIL